MLATVCRTDGWCIIECSFSLYQTPSNSVMWLKKKSYNS